MTIKQRMFLTEVSSHRGVHIVDTYMMDKRTLASVLYHDWVVLDSKDNVKLTIEGAEALNHANHLSIYIKHATPFKKAKIYQMRKRA